MKTLTAIALILFAAWCLLFSRPIPGGRCAPAPLDVCYVQHPETLRRSP
jgi:hypothetical protein